MMLLLLLWVTTVFCNDTRTTTIYDIKAAAELAISLRKFLSCDSITVLHSGDENRQEGDSLVRMIKCLSKGDVPTAVLDLRQQAISSNTLHVIISSDHQTTNYLSLIPQTESKASRWLLFLDQKDAFEDVIGEVFLPLHCQFLVATYLKTYRMFTLLEVYRTAAERPLQRLQFGSWSTDMGLTAPFKDFFIRRRNLHGIFIRGGTVFSPTISHLKSSKELLDGLEGQIWSLLQETLNFRTVVLVAADHSGGSRLDNGSYTGLMGMIQRQQIQVTVNPMLMSSTRVEAAHFSVPLLPIHEDIFVRHTLNNAVGWQSYLAPFSSRLWLVLLAIYCTIALVLYIISRFGHEEIYTAPTWYDILFYVQAAFFQQGQVVMPSSTPSRIAYITCYLTAIVILASYSAFLISSLTLRTPELPFRSLEELLQTRTHKFGTYAPSGEFFLFQDASDGVLKDVYTQMLLPELQDLPGSNLEGLRRVCERHNYAYFTSMEYMMIYLNHLTCAVTTLPRHVFVFHIGLVFPKDSPYIGIFNYAIQRAQETGLLHRLKSLALNHFPREVPESYVPVALRNVVSIFVFLTCGIALSLLILAVEVAWAHHTNTQ